MGDRKKYVVVVVLCVQLGFPKTRALRLLQGHTHYFFLSISLSFSGAYDFLPQH